MNRENEQSRGGQPAKGDEKELRSTVVVQPGSGQIAQNPNPRANENTKETSFNREETNEVGSEITDGEDA